jgi:hypothetical protein
MLNNHSHTGLASKLQKKQDPLQLSSRVVDASIFLYFPIFPLTAHSELGCNNASHGRTILILGDDPTSSSFFTQQRQEACSFAIDSDPDRPENSNKDDHYLRSRAISNSRVHPLSLHPASDNLIRFGPHCLTTESATSFNWRSRLIIPAARLPIIPRVRRSSLTKTITHQKRRSTCPDK